MDGWGCGLDWEGEGLMIGDWTWDLEGCGLGKYGWLRTGCDRRAGILLDL